MALLMEGMPKPRGQRNEDNLLGMTDASFQDMGRAPVDELWAGRFSANIDDDEFAEKEAKAKAIREKALENREAAINYNMQKHGVDAIDAEVMWADQTRMQISDETGLDLYPGDLNATEDQPQFMEEFSDQGAGFRYDAFDKLKAAEETGKQVHLGEVLQHPRFFESYPEAQFMSVTNDPSYRGTNTYGSYLNHSWLGDYPEAEKQYRELAPLGQISLNSDLDKKDTMETLLHELQHYIQSVEGWENGASDSPELGRQFIEDQLSYKGKDGTAGLSADITQMDVDNADGLFEFQRLENASDDLAFEAYEATSGEELARAATRRWREGTQLTDYYFGSPNRFEEMNWNQEGDDIAPLDTTVQERELLEQLGLMGILDRKTMKDLREMNAEEFEEYVGPHAGKTDEHLHKLKGLLEVAK